MAFRMPGKEVRLSKQGNKVLLAPIEEDWDTFFDALSSFTDDFMDDGRQQPPMQQRENF
jgi:antitoxin VapB